MPTYEYRCPDGHEFELFQRMSDPPQAECPECGKLAERIISPGAGLLFKGSGFYTTDYRSDSYKKAAEKEKGGDKPKDGSKGGGAKGAETKGSSPPKDAGSGGASTSKTSD